MTNGLRDLRAWQPSFKQHFKQQQVIPPRITIQTLQLCACCFVSACCVHSIAMHRTCIMLLYVTNTSHQFRHVPTRAIAPRVWNVDQRRRRRTMPPHSHQCAA